MPFTSVPFTGLNSTADDGAGWATADGMTILFESTRGGNTDLWEAVHHRDTWIVERRIELDTLAPEGTPWLSPDGTVVVFSTNRNGTDDLYIATRAP
jgi:Tol biopolymer transport system component